MRVLITGVTGFLGSAVARACVAAGHEVRAFRRPSSQLTRLAGIVEHIAFYDTSDAGIDAALDSIRGCDAVIHTATCYGRQGESMSALLETNAIFPLRILEKVSTQDGGLFLNFDTVLDPRINAYSLSKRQFADWGRLIAKFGRLRFVNVRLEHLYGPGDEPSRFVTQIIRQCLSNAASIPLTEGQQMRDFIHVNDAVAGIMQLLDESKKLPLGWSEFDLGSGCQISIRQLVELIHRLTFSQAKLCFGVIPYRDHETMETNADISRLTKLGWLCRVPLNDGLAQTINFERAKLEAEKLL